MRLTPFFYVWLSFRLAYYNEHPLVVVEELSTQVLVQKNKTRETPADLWLRLRRGEIPKSADQSCPAPPG
jgi:hypothetical protein